jgi:signal transduction histidine kinase
MRTQSDTSFAERRSGAERRRLGRIDAAAVGLMLEQMADGVLVVDREGIIRFANPAAATLFDRTANVLAGQSFGFPVMAGESTEIELLQPDGQTVAVELRAVDYEWAGQPATLISLRDITDRKCLEEERLARARAEAASQAKSDFLTLMSHELRTPLNAVIGYSELLLMEEGSDPVTSKQRAQLARILASGKNLRDLVDKMLDLAEAGEGRLELAHASAPALRSADRAIEAAAPAARARGVQLAEHCSGEDGTVFVGDEERVRQILAILIDNAIKFTPAGGTVTVECDVVETPPPGARLTGAGPWTRWRV